MKNSQILIVDYGMGNITSVAMALDFLGVDDYKISGKKQDIEQSCAFILPGVGAYHTAMENLNSLGIIDPLTEHVVHNRKPFLGICLGLQLLAEDSTEKGYSKGLGWIKGHVKNIVPKEGFRVPHVGWNNISATGSTFLFDNISGDMNFYFDHSYHLECNDELKIAVASYGTEIVAAIQKDNIVATQFHPEKSQRNGLKLLRNYLNFIKHHGR